MVKRFKDVLLVNDWKAMYEKKCHRQQIHLFLRLFWGMLQISITQLGNIWYFQTYFTFLLCYFGNSKISHGAYYLPKMDKLWPYRFKGSTCFRLQPQLAFRELIQQKVVYVLIGLSGICALLDTHYVALLPVPKPLRQLKDSLSHACKTRLRVTRSRITVKNISLIHRTRSFSVFFIP